MELPVKRPDETDDLRDSVSETQKTRYDAKAGGVPVTSDAALDEYVTFGHNLSIPYGLPQTTTSSSFGKGRSNHKPACPKTYQLNRPAELNANKERDSQQQLHDMAHTSTLSATKSNSNDDLTLMEQILVRKPPSRNKHLVPVNAIVLPRPSTGPVPTVSFPTIINSSQRMPIVNNTKFSFPTGLQHPFHTGSHTQVNMPPYNVASASAVDNTALAQPVQSCSEVSNSFMLCAPHSETLYPGLTSQSPYLLVDQMNPSTSRQHQPTVGAECQQNYSSLMSHAKLYSNPEPSTSRLATTDSIKVKLESVQLPEDVTSEIRSNQPLLHSLLQQTSTKRHRSTTSASLPVKQESMGTIEGNVDNLTDTINRVAAGESELKLPESPTDIPTTEANDTDVLEDQVKAENSLQTIEESSSKRSVKRQKAKSKQKMKMKVNFVQRKHEEREKKRSSQQDLESRYMIADPNLGSNTYDKVFRPDSDAIKEVETMKLSSVSGHHLLSLTEAEKEYLRYRGYISPIKSIAQPTADIAKPIYSIKKLQQPNVIVDNTTINTIVNSKIRSEMITTCVDGSSNNETFNLVKTPIVLLNRVDGSQSVATVRSTTSQMTTHTTSLPRKSVTQQTKVFYVLSKKQHSGLASSNQKNESVNQNALSTQSVDSIKRELGSPLSSHSLRTSGSPVVKCSSCQSPKKPEKYICLGNNRYRIVDSPKRGGATLIKSEDNPKSPNEKPTDGRTSASNTQFLTVSGSTQYGKKNKKLTVADLLKIKRESDSRSSTPNVCNPVQMLSRAMNPNKSPYTEMIIKLNDIAHDLNAASRQMDVGQATRQPGSSKHSGESREMTSTTSLPAIAHGSKVRLEIPIKIINPKNVPANQTAEKGLSDVSGKERKASTDTMSKPITTWINLSSSKKMDNSSTSEEHQKRKTLPAPKPKNKINAELMKKKKAKSKRKLNDKPLKGELRKSINHILSKSNHPMMKLACSLDLIPKEIAVKKAFNLPEDNKSGLTIPKRNVPKSNKTSPKPTMSGVKGSSGVSTCSNYSADILQIYKTADGKCDHSLHRVQITFRMDSDDLCRWYSLGDHPCILHFSDAGLIEHLEVESINKGMYVILDCTDCMPANRRRSVRASLSMYPPYVEVIPPNTLAFAVGDITALSNNSPSKGVTVKDIASGDLEDMLMKLLGNGDDVRDAASFMDRYSSVADKNESPKQHSTIFYTDPHKNCFEKGVVADSDSSESVSNINNNTCVSNTTPLCGKIALTTRFSERAMALKKKQIELLECCKRLKDKKAKTSRKRKRQDDGAATESTVSSVAAACGATVGNNAADDSVIVDVCGSENDENGDAGSESHGPMVEIIRCSEYGSGSREEILNVDS